MKEVRIITLDNRGRLVIPKIIRKSLGITNNSQLMLVADSENKEIKIVPVGLGDESLKFKIVMKDEAGSLAKILSIFGERGISLVYEESVVLEKNKSAMCTLIGPKPQDINLEEFEKVLKTEGNALEVEIVTLE
jgi:AbrB family looped-hinge helix DNA binding protein